MTATFFYCDTDPDMRCSVCFDKPDDSNTPWIAHRDVLGKNPNKLIHHIHKTCLSTWEDHANTCPTCRFPISEATSIDNLGRLIVELKETKEIKNATISGSLYGVALVALGMAGASKAIDSFRNPMVDSAIGLSTLALSCFIALRNGKNIFSSTDNFFSRVSSSVLTTAGIGLTQLILQGSITQLAGSAIFGEIDAAGIFEYRYDNPTCSEIPSPPVQILHSINFCAPTVAGMVAGTIASSKGIKSAIGGAGIAILTTAIITNAASVLATGILTLNELPDSLSTVATIGLTAIICAGALGGVVGTLAKKHWRIFT